MVLTANFSSYNDELARMIKTFTKQSQKSVDLAAYTLDREFSDYLTDAKHKGRSVRILLDPEQASAPSCHMQPNALRTLRSWHIPMRIARPHGPYKMMHLKQWIWDDGLVLICSMNASRNSAHSAYEGGMFSKYTRTVDRAKEYFEELWNRGEEVPEEAFVDPQPRSAGGKGDRRRDPPPATYNSRRGRGRSQNAEQSM